MSIYAVGNNILVKKLSVHRPSIIHVPDSTMQKQFYGIIVNVGPDVKEKYLRPDVICFFDPMCSGAKNEYDGFYFFKEKDIIAIKQDKIYRPLGHRILIKRLNEETKIGSIIIPVHDTVDQSLKGIVCYKGINNGGIIPDELYAGDTVMIEKWSINLQEIDINGEYFLSVPVKELAYVERS